MPAKVEFPSRSGDNSLLADFFGINPGDDITAKEQDAIDYVKWHISMFKTPGVELCSEALAQLAILEEHLKKIEDAQSWFVMDYA